MPKKKTKEQIKKEFDEQFAKEKWITEENISALNTNIYEIIKPQIDLDKAKDIRKEITKTKKFNKDVSNYKRNVKHFLSLREKAIKKDDMAMLKHANTEINKLSMSEGFNIFKSTKLKPLKFLKSELSKALGEPQIIYFHTPGGTFGVGSKRLSTLKNPGLHILKRADTKFRKLIELSYIKIIGLDPEEKIKLENQIRGLESLRYSIQKNMEAVKKHIPLIELEIDEEEEDKPYEINYSFSFDRTEIDISIVGGGKRQNQTTSKNKKTKHTRQKRKINITDDNINF